jgi:hypothetical protein
MIDHDLLDDLAAAKLNYEQALVAETQAQETSKRALKALNDAQQALDAAVQALKAGAHPTSSWGARSEPKAAHTPFRRPDPWTPAKIGFNAVAKALDAPETQQEEVS